MQKPLLLEAHLNEIYTLINENQTSFDRVWDLAKEKINSALKNIKTKDDAVSYIIQLYSTIKNFPDVIKKRIFKYVLTLLVATFGLNVILGALPTNIQKTAKDETPELIGKALVKPKAKEQITPAKSSEAIKDFIKGEEDFSLKAYALGDGMVTVGWGHAEPKRHSHFKVGHKITREKAQQLFDKDIIEAETGLNRILTDWEEEGINIKVNQDMYDAMVSMIFNMGIGNFRNSDFIQLVKQNKMMKAKREILTTNANYKGVKERRKKEANKFGHGVLLTMMTSFLREYIRKEVAKLIK